MGTWGPDIFSDDIARDVRSEYRLLLGSGKTAQEAEDMLIGYYAGRLDDADRDVFWFALALSEWKAGRLSLAVKEKALDALDRGDDLARWAQNGKEKAFQKRMAVLENLRATLLFLRTRLGKYQSPPSTTARGKSAAFWPIGSLPIQRNCMTTPVLENTYCFGSCGCKSTRYPVCSIPGTTMNLWMLHCIIGLETSSRSRGSWNDCISFQLWNRQKSRSGCRKSLH